MACQAYGIYFYNRVCSFLALTPTMPGYTWNHLIRFIPHRYEVKGYFLWFALSNKTFSSIWFLPLFLESIAEGWHSVAHALFITDKVTVGVVASVCQCPSAPNPPTASLAQVVGTALPYDKHSLVEGSWTRARHPKDERQWTEQLLYIACLIFGPFPQTLIIMYLLILS